MEEVDFVESAVTYILEKRYPDGSSNNAKRMIRKKASTLVVRNGEVYYLRPTKNSDGSKVHVQNKCHTVRRVFVYLMNTVDCPGA